MHPFVLTSDSIIPYSRSNFEVRRSNGRGMRRRSASSRFADRVHDRLRFATDFAPDGRTFGISMSRNFC